MRLLPIEDELTFARAVQEQLRSEGHAVDHAANGADGLALAERHKYGLVGLDVGLPDRSGFEVCRILRQRGDSRPLLMLTGRERTADKVAGLDSGADDYWVKPFEPAELMARIRALLRTIRGHGYCLSADVA